MSKNESPARIAFESECVTVPISALLPVRPPRASVKASHKYLQIRASVIEIGLVEPPAIARIPGNPDHFLLLDGHLRVEILKDLGRTGVECLISTDDEAFTFNKRISRLSAVQEHAMILKAIARGVPDEKIARALSLHVNSIQRKARLLDGICQEVVGLMKDRICPMAVFEILKRMKPLRQIEAAELMIAANNYSVGYATALLAGTPANELVGEVKPKKVKGVSPEAMARMEKELARLQESIADIQDTYGKEHLQLTVVRGTSRSYWAILRSFATCCSTGRSTLRNSRPSSMPRPLTMRREIVMSVDRRPIRTYQMPVQRQPLRRFAPRSADRFKVHSITASCLPAAASGRPPPLAVPR